MVFRHAEVLVAIGQSQKVIEYTLLSIQFTVPDSRQCFTRYTSDLWLLTSGLYYDLDSNCDWKYVTANTGHSDLPYFFYLSGYVGL